MSCYMVEKDVIDAVVWKAVEQRIGNAFEDPHAFGQMLVDANIESVINRYNSTKEKETPAWLEEAGGTYRWPSAGNLWPMLVDGSAAKTDEECWKAIRELDYQISECEDIAVHNLLMWMMIDMGNRVYDPR